MKELRIVFMGTPDFAVASLKTLIVHGYTIVGVVTAPDRPAGRGRKMQESAVKKYALQQNLKVLQPTNLKDVSFLNTLKSLDVNLQIVVAFRMLPEVVWKLPEHGTFNLHASLLPDYRGAAPINWAIINGETETGVTTFFIDDKIDTGEIILQEKTHIEKNETAGSLHDKLMVMGADLVLKTVQQIESGDVKKKPQKSTGKLNAAHKIHKATCQIDWSKPLDRIFDHIRGLSPYPAAWTSLVDGDEQTLLKVYEVSKEKKEHDLKIGELRFDKNELKVAVNGGFINLLEIQLSGKRRMAANEVLNGLKLSKFAHMA